MRKFLLSIAFSLGVITFLQSCKTYSIPVSDFKRLFEGKDVSKEYSFRGPMNIPVTYKIYPIDSIRCLDKKGNSVFVKNSRSLEIKVVDMSKQNHNIFFHSIRIIDNRLIGSETLQANDWQLSWETSSQDPLSIKSEPYKIKIHSIRMDSIQMVTVIKW